MDPSLERLAHARDLNFEPQTCSNVRNALYVDIDLPENIKLAPYNGCRHNVKLVL